MTETGLFAGPAPRVRTIAPAAPFLDTLIEALIAACDSADPFALARCVVLVPNQRAASAFNTRFAARFNGAALLPTVRPLGDVDDDADVWGAEPIEFGLSPAIAPLRRRFELARLVRARDAAEGGVDDPLRALAFADDLARLLDATAATGKADWDKLDTLVEDAALAVHWRASAQFLRIITEFWPSHLAEQGLSDPGARRAQVLQALAIHWRQDPPPHPVIIAGSTGSVVATRALMETVARLPRGVVVLPGLDTLMDDQSWAAITAQHPQATMKNTIEALGVERAAIAPMGEARHPARSFVLREALAPADVTADWRQRLERAGGAALVREGLAGVTLVEARTEDEEALAIALILRETLETPDGDAALVTPDAGLARRVEAKLARWGVRPLRSLGSPLAETPPGALLTLLGNLLLDDGAPVDLAALLVTPLVVAGPLSAALREGGAHLLRDHLRGPRRHSALADLAGQCGGAARVLCEQIAHSIAPLRVVARAENLNLSDIAEALAQTGENLAGAEALWSQEDGRAASAFMADMIAHAAALGTVTLHAGARAFSTLLAACEVTPPRDGEARIAILGPLEARLARPDCVVLGGLNEGIWPAPPREDMLLSRAMREAIGLPSLDLRLGLAAHDFAQLANAPRVVMTRALRINGAPSVASRWIWRLQALADAAGARACMRPNEGADHLQWAKALDAPSEITPICAPSPRPPADRRLSRISFTDVRTLQVDPYALYVRRILGIEETKPIAAPAGARERGTALHVALANFGDGADAAELLEHFDCALAKAGFDATRRRGERARLRITAQLCVEWMAQQRADGVRAVREAKAALVHETGFELYGRADAILFHRDGSADVLDFKTGKPPNKSEVSLGLFAQLTLEAVALMAGAIEGEPAALPRDLIYGRIGNSEPEFKALDFAAPVSEIAADALAKLAALMARYRQSDQPFLSKPRPMWAKNMSGPIDLLARRAEWANADEEGEE
jgi:ATP-dependent helicase/nuclease subunit B